MATLRVLRLNSDFPMQQPGAGIEDIKGPTTGNCDTPGFTDGPIAYTFFRTLPAKRRHVLTTEAHA